MSAHQKIKYLLIDIYESWSYLILTGLAASITFFKVFLYAQVLTASEFSNLNYFYTYVFIFLLLLGVGVINRSHVEFADKVLSGATVNELNKFSSQFKVNILFHSLVALMFSFLVSKLVPIENFGYLIYAIIFSTLFLWFLVDIILLKSHGMFSEYGKKLLARNIFIFLFLK